MKRTLLAALAGVALGATAVWLVLRHPEPPAPGKAEEPAPAASTNHDRGLHLSREQLDRAGLRVAAPQEREIRPEVAAYGRVLDAAPLAAALFEADAAAAALVASRKEFERLQTLRAGNQNASARALESAEAAMKRDTTAVEAVRARLLATWGKEVMQQADLPALVRSLVARECALVRVDLLPGDSLTNTPAALRICPRSAEGDWREAEVLGPAPSADPQAQGLAYLALVRQRPPRPGAALLARIGVEGGLQRVLTVPRAAVVRHAGETYAFVRTGEGIFERRLLGLGVPLEDGVVVLTGLTARDQVVVSGGQQLLSQQLGAEEETP